MAQPTARKLSLVIRYLMLSGCIVGIACFVVYMVYLHHTWHFPRHAGDVIQEVEPVSAMSPRALTAWALDTRVLRPAAYYFFGLQSAIRRLGNPVRPFFRGALVEASSRSYFPVLYLIKEPLALHLLTLVALLFALWRLHAPLIRRGWLRDHFTEFAFLLTLLLYWGVSIRSPLKLGVRHVLPTFPFVFILVGAGLAAVADRLRTRTAAWSIAVAVTVLLTWQAATVIRVHPSYLAYFNELAGGPDGGLEWAGDSNLDWGQDLKRLAEFVNEHEIQTIHLDYFGSAVPGQYLRGKEQRIQRCTAPQRGWVAVSAFWYQKSRAKPECDYRRWLTKERFVTKIGYSILVFRVD